MNVAERRYPPFPIPGVGAVVVSKEGILLVRRDKNPGKGLWSLPGGGVEIGESQEDAVLREVLEETGVECEVLNLISTYDVIHPDENGMIEYHFLLNHYLAKALTTETRPESADAEVAWFDKVSLPFEEIPDEIVDVIMLGLKMLESNSDM